MADVQLVLATKEYFGLIKDSGFDAILKDVGISYELGVCSPYLNASELEQFAKSAADAGTKLFIAVDTSAAGLPAVLAGCTGLTAPVIGVPANPPGARGSLQLHLPVLLTGIGPAGLRNAALAACQILAVADRSTRLSLGSHLSRHHEVPEFNIAQLEAK